MSRSLSRTRGTAAALVLALPAALLTIGAADAAPGKPGAKPTAPTHLVVDDLTAPLDAATTPRFGWLPQDVDPNEVQTAYKIEVRDAGGTHRVGQRQGVVLASSPTSTTPGADLERGARTPGASAPGTATSAPRPGRPGPASRPRSPTPTGATRPGSAVPPATPTPARSASSTAAAGSAAATSRSPRPGADWTDYVVTMDVTPITRAAAVVFRAPDSRTGYMWQLHANDNAIKTHRMIGGAFPTDARRTVPHVIDPGVTYHLSIKVAGPDVHDQRRRHRSSTPGPTRPATGSRAGTIGFREASGEVADFDNVSVTSLDGATTLFSEDFSGDLRPVGPRLDRPGGRRVHPGPHRGRRPRRQGRPRPQLPRCQPHRRALPRRRARRPDEQLRLPERGLLPGRRRHRPRAARQAACPSARCCTGSAPGRARRRRPRAARPDRPRLRRRVRRTS